MINLVAHFPPRFREGLSADAQSKPSQKPADNNSAKSVLSPLQQDMLSLSTMKKPLLNTEDTHRSGYDFNATLELRTFLTDFPHLINANKRLALLNPAVLEAWETGLQSFKITSLNPHNEQALIEEGLMSQLLLHLPEKFTALMLRDPKSDNYSELAYPKLKPYTLNVAYQPDPVKEGRYLLVGEFPVPSKTETTLRKEPHFDRIFKGQFTQAINQQFDELIKDAVLTDLPAQIRYESIRHDMRHQFISMG